MARTAAIALLIVLMGARSGHAQAPTGTISGVVTDASGAILVGVQVRISNRDTGLARPVITSLDGRYSTEALPPGQYLVTAQAPGFKKVERTATLEAGTTTTANLRMELGDVSDIVRVSLAPPLLHYEHHQVGGVVTREQIESLPLNGRSFLDLAKLEPGVTGLVRASNNRSFVPALGAGLQTIPRIGDTSVTVDGGSIAAIGAIGSGMQVTQDVVQEFQISTVNFDAATNLTSNTAINIVTRSGGNTYDRDAFVSYRDHNLSAYPDLKPNPVNPDPFFRRGQYGASVGGPIRRDRVFVFADYERNDQRGVESRQPAAFPELAGIFPSPYVSNQFSARVDVRIHDHHNGFVRYTHDGNHAFAPGGGPASAMLLPSAWSRLANHDDQTLAALTSTLSTNVVNDARVSYFFSTSPESPASQADCPGCLGVGAPRITVQGASFAIGTARTLSGAAGRFQLTDNLVWQHGRHRFRAGVDWEHSASTNSLIDNDQAIVTLFSPQLARKQGVVVPDSFTTLDDILQLPLRSFQTSVGPGSVFRRNFGPARILDLYRVFVSDTWRGGTAVTVNAGLGWSYEPNALNTDLSKPALLLPILGSDGLAPPAVERANFSPTLGVAWTPTADRKTVLRAGAGRYYDPMSSANAVDLTNERQALLPLGTGRLTVSGSNISLNGQTLDFSVPSSFRGQTLLANLTAIRSQLALSINPDNRDFTVRNIDLTKEATSLIDPRYRTPSAVHVSAGVQRAFADDVVVSADVVWRRFTNTFISGIDYNRFASQQGPIIPRCTQAQRDDLSAVCSNGPILFSNTSGRARYKGLLVSVEKRLSHRTQLLASYALGSWVGTNGTGAGTGFNNDNWSENYGPLPTDIRHIFNLSGLVELPWRLQLSANISAYSRPPLSAYVAGKDFNGDGTESDLLPGTTVNQLGRGLGKADLERLVGNYNAQFPATPLTLPSGYEFNDSFFTQDLRVSRAFGVGPRKARLSLIFEVFNLFNTENLVGYSGDLTQTTFGKPTARFTQVFGSGGPRAVQLGARVGF